MGKHGGTPSWRDKHVTPAAISPPGVAWGRFVGGQQSGLAGCRPPPLYTRRAPSCSSQGRREGEPRGACPRPSVPTYLPFENYAASEHLNRYWNVVSAPTDDEWPKTLTEDADTLFLNDRLAVTQNRVEALIDHWHNAQLMLAGGDKMQRDL